VQHDWEAVTREAVAQLQRLLQFRTVNPPGDERSLAEYLVTVLTAARIDARLIETAPGRAAVVGRIAGSGDKPPIILLAHSDVVGVDADRWSTDPFGGEIRDGYVYGRGAIDDKGMLAANLMTMLLLRREMESGALQLDRDVVFIVTPDEEAGGTFGMGWIVQHEPGLLRAEYAINEGGRIRVGANGSRTLLLQVAEKTSHLVMISARGKSGHAGVPRADNAILRLGRALAHISGYAAGPAHGVSPTVLAAGSPSATNVIPDEARATLNVRTTPDQSLAHVLSDLRRLIDDDEVTVTIVEEGEPAPASPEDSPMFRALADAARDLDPDIVVRPYLSAGITDSAELRRAGVKAYGVLPFPLSAEDEARMHGVDERVPVAALGFGTRLILGAVRRIAVSG
jgi:acetylornithine deacetylase/succinyl-diaminopimelate desuccinylase-like protein